MLFKNTNCKNDAAFIAVDSNDLELLVNNIKHKGAEVSLEVNLAKMKIISTGKSDFF